MKKTLSISIMLVILITGCTTYPQYTYTSEIGRRCWNTCASQRSQCNAYCFGALSCIAQCRDSGIYCMDACPDLYSN